jgi:serine/threonine protein kinase
MLFSVNNTFVLPLYDIINTPLRFAVVTDHFARGDLGTLIENVGTLVGILQVWGTSRKKLTILLQNMSNAQFVAAQLVLALNYLHSLDIVHRDVKPENVLVSDHSYVCLTGLGPVVFSMPE